MSPVLLCLATEDTDEVPIWKLSEGQTRSPYADTIGQLTFQQQYEVQLGILELQNQKRLMVARQELSGFPNSPPSVVR